MRPGFVSLVCLLALTVSLRGSDIGVSVNGTCEAGSCPPQVFPFNFTDTLPFDFTYTLADGDMYLIYGSFTGSNNSNGGGLSTGRHFQVTYEGNATGGPSAADTVTVEVEYAFQTTLGEVDLNRNVIGAFGPTIAASSSASSCVDGTLGCVGPVTPPGSFDRTAGYLLGSSNGTFVIDGAYTNNFGAGSPVGSYIVWGQTAALPPPPPSVPEPASPGLLALGLGGLIALRARLRHVA